MQRITGAKQGDELSRSEKRRLRVVLLSFIEKVIRSPLGEVELDAEPAIRDFIIDLMLKSTGLAMSMRAVLEVGALFEEDDSGLEMDVVKDNVKVSATCCLVASSPYVVALSLIPSFSP